MSGTITINSTDLASAIKPQLLQMPEITQQPYSYVIWTDGTNYYAKNGKTGQIDFSGTDASTVIQNAIDQLIGTGGRILLKSGVYNITSTIKIGSHITFEGEAIGYYSSPTPTILRLANGANVPLLVAKGEAQNGKSNYITIRNIWFSGNAQNQTTAVDMVDLSKGSSVLIDRCYFYGAKRTALIVIYAWVINSIFSNIGSSAISAITDNYLANLNISGAVNDPTYTGNGAISLGSGYNIIVNSAIYLTTYGRGIYGYGSVGNIIVGNMVHDNQRDGILLDKGSNNNIVIGNIVTDNSTYGQGVFSGITIHDSTRNIVIGNISINTKTSNLQKYGIYEYGTSDYNLIIGNYVKGNYASQGISVSGKNTVAIYNIGYNPMAVITIDIPANTTTTLGPYQYPVQIILSSPTNATNVSITRATTSTPLPIQSTYYMYPGDTLSITEGSTPQTAYVIPL